MLYSLSKDRHFSSFPKIYRTVFLMAKSSYSVDQNRLFTVPQSLTHTEIHDLPLNVCDPFNITIHKIRG